MEGELINEQETLDGELGYKGERGYSAYEIAVLHGYEGTEQDWIDHFGLDLSDYIQTSDVVDDLTSTSTNYPLSAKQGKELKTLIDSKANVTDVYSKSDFAVISGTITYTGNYGVVEIAYPTGFNNTNCVVVGGKLDGMVIPNSGFTGIASQELGIDFFSNIFIYSSGITLASYKSTAQQGDTEDYKIVLMKI